MPSLNASGSASVSIPAGQVLTISQGGDTIVTLSTSKQPFEVGIQGGTLGPYPSDVTAYISVQLGIITYKVWTGSNAVTSTTDAVSGALKYLAGDGGYRYLNVFTPKDNTFSSVQAANILCASMGGGILQFDPVTYNFGSNSLTLLQGVHYQGAGFDMTYASIVDSPFNNLTGGTVIQGDGTNVAFSINDVDLGSPYGTPAAFFNAGITGCSVDGFGFLNCLVGLKVGANYNAGAYYSRFTNCMAKNCTWGFWFENNMHVYYHQLYALGCGGSKFRDNRYGGGFMFRISASNSVVQPANCEIGQIMCTAAPNLLAKGVWFEGVNNTQGGMYGASVIQSNRFNNPTFNSGNTVTITGNGTTTINLTGTGFDATAQLEVGAPFATSTTALGFTVNRVFVVRSIIDANNITAAVDMGPSTPLLSPSAGTTTMLFKGYAPLTGISYDTSKTGIGKCKLLDLESGGTALMYLDGCNGGDSCHVSTGDHISNVTDVSLRRVTGGITIDSLADGVYDFDGLSSASIVMGRASLFSWTVGFAMGVDTNVPLHGATGARNSLTLASTNAWNGAATFIAKQPQFGGFTYPGTPFGIRTNYSNSTSLNFGMGNGVNNQNGYHVFKGTAPATRTWNQGGFNAGELVGMVQVYKNQSNTAGATLTITLDASSGTFDGLTGGTSLGKSIILQPATGTTLGGVLEMVCVQTGASSYEWSVKSLTNGAIV